MVLLAPSANASVRFFTAAQMIGRKGIDVLLAAIEALLFADKIRSLPPTNCNNYQHMNQ